MRCRNCTFRHPGHGHWDFTDTGVSLINLASVRALSQACGTDLDPRRFRGNLFVDGLPAWSEFGLIGKRYNIGDAIVEFTRPAKRCAATTVDLDTGDTGINVPVVLRKLTGHLYCGIYMRVVEGGNIECGDRFNEIGEWHGNPSDNLPERTPDPTEWPRFYRATQSDSDTIKLTSLTNSWPIGHAKTDQKVRVHPSGDDGVQQSRTLALQSATDDEAWFLRDGELAKAVGTDGRLLISGPF